MSDQKIIKEIKDNILSNKCTVVIFDDNEMLFSSHSRGLKPLIEAYDSKLPVGLYAGDKAVGKAAAQIFHLIGVKYLYAALISKPALDYLKSTDIETEYTEIVDRILSRDKEDLCPMEEIAINSNNDMETLIKVKEKLESPSK